jgi:hypothetical protein
MPNILGICFIQCFHPNILHHYVEFDIRTITTLEELLSARSFGSFISHLVHCHATFLASSSGLYLPFIV